MDNPRDALLSDAKTESLLLQTYVSLPPHLETPASGPSDHVAVKILGMFHSVILADHTPLQIHSDGNCLYRAISRGMFGYEEEHALIRLLATLEIAEHREFYDYTAVNFIDLVKDNQIVSVPYTTLLKEAATLTHYSEMLHIYAVSAATGLALRSYCPPTINAEYLSAHLTRKICGRRVGQVSIPALTVIWSQASVPATASSFKPNHFVLLGEPERRVINVDLTCSPQKISDTEWPELPSLSTSSPLSSPLSRLSPPPCSPISMCENVASPSSPIST